MDEAIPLSAEEVIRRIRVERGVEKSIMDRVAQDPEIALMVKFKDDTVKSSLSNLSRDLYTKDSHFILELIQNADDNKYAENISPSLTISLYDRQARLDCNELGFSQQDVEAICKVGASTKKKDKSAGYIGEKGIGFKSVFKAANIVYIKSRDYSFKFDVTDPVLKDMGMLTPTWSDFPALSLPNHTHILMELLPACEWRSLQVELKTLKPTVILFLQKLRRLTINIGDDWYRTFECEKEVDGSSVTITESCGIQGTMRPQIVWNYLVSRFTLENLPVEEKRLGITQTEVILAFPLLDGKPHLAKQNVHAFLPLRDFGFKVRDLLRDLQVVDVVRAALIWYLPQFLIQADFLVPSNREDILDCDWNRALRSSIVETFHRAVNQFSQMDGLRYTWLRFVPRGWFPETFLSPLIGHYPVSLLAYLTVQPILESRANTFGKPIDLLRIPDVFLDRYGNPLLGGTEQWEHQLSPNYNTEDLDIIHALGVRDMDDEMFYNDLAPINENVLRKMPLTWHEDLAHTLNNSKWLERHYMVLQQTPLIPLRDGSWVSSSFIKSSSVYFEGSDDMLGVPPAIEIQIVDPCAARSPDRKKLYERLGAKMCDHREVCKLIVQMHWKGLRGEYSIDVLKSHVVYLFNFKSLCMSKDVQSMWLRDSSKPISHCRQGSDLYIDIPGSKFAVSAFIPKGTSDFHFIHPDFLLAPKGYKQKEWIEWLVTQCGISDIPRIKDKGKMTLSGAFRSLIKSLPSWVLLKLLAEHWHRYSRDISDQIKHELSTVMVDCAGGRRHLKETILPLPDLIKKAKQLGAVGLPVVKSEDPDGDLTAFQNFRELGVVTIADAGFYMAILQDLQSREATQEDSVRQVYQQLRNQIQTTGQYTEAIRSAFDKLPLVFIPKSNWSLPRWVSSRECVWKAPMALRSKVPLCHHYSDYSNFFRLTIGIPDASPAMVIDEIIALAKKTTTAETINSIKEMINVLLSYSKKEQNSVTEQFRKLRGLPFLPVRQPETGLVSLKNLGDKFFLQDRKELYQTFKDSLPFLDFEVDDIRRIRPLIDFLDIGNKSIYSALTESWDIDGIKTADEELTRRLQKKSQYLFWCEKPREVYWFDIADRMISCARHYESPKAQQKNYDLRKKLSSLRVIRAEQLWRVQTISSQGFRNTKRIKSLMHLDDAKDGLVLYVPRTVAREDLDGILSYYLPQSLISFLGISKNMDIAKQKLSNVLLLSGKVLENALDDAEIRLNTEPDKEDDYFAPTKPRLVFKIEAHEAGLLTKESNPAPTLDTESEVNPAAPLVPNNSVPPISQPPLPKKSARLLATTVPNNTTNDDIREISSDTDSEEAECCIRPGTANTSPRDDDSEYSDELGKPRNPRRLMSMSFQQIFPQYRARLQGISSRVDEDYDYELADIVSCKVLKKNSTKNTLKEPNPNRFSILSAGRTFNVSKKLGHQGQREAEIFTGFQGEFFAVKLLSKMIPDFDAEINWTSALRSYAREEPHFRHLTDYTAPEVTDITYKDRDDHLTKWLIESGETRAKDWLAASPTYHIEVKTTTGGCDEPFSMSSYQVQLAEEMTSMGKMAPNKVYCIFRAYHMNATQRFRLYLDPWSLIEAGELVMTPDEYAVTIAA